MLVIHFSVGAAAASHHIQTANVFEVGETKIAKTSTYISIGQRCLVRDAISSTEYGVQVETLPHLGPDCGHALRQDCRR